MKNHSPLSRALLALLVAIAAVPVTTQALFRSIDPEGRNIFQFEDIREDAIEYHQTEWRERRRLYSYAVETFRDLRRQGVRGIVAPDINDLDSIMRYLDENMYRKYEATVRLHGSAEPDLRIEDLKSTDAESLILYYVSIEYCPSYLAEYRHPMASRFLDLCNKLVAERKYNDGKSILREDARFRGGLFNKTGPMQTLKLRLQMIEEAYNGTRRTAVPKQYLRLQRADLEAANAEE